jgi:hypothetical protein
MGVFDDLPDEQTPEAMKGSKSVFADMPDTPPPSLWDRVKDAASRAFSAPEPAAPGPQAAPAPPVAGPASAPKPPAPAAAEGPLTRARDIVTQKAAQQTDALVTTGAVPSPSFLSEEGLDPRYPQTERSSRVLTRARSLARGLIGVPEFVGTGIEIAGAKTGMEGVEEFGKTARTWLGEKREGIKRPSKFQDKTVFDHPEFLLDTDWWADQLPEMGVSFAVPIGGAGIAAKGTIKILGQTAKLAPGLAARLVKLGMVGTGGAIGGAMEGTATYKETLEKTKDQEKAIKAGEAMTAYSALLNGISFAKLLEKAPPGIIKKTLDWLLTGVTEAGTEYAEVPAEIAAELGAGINVPEAERVQRMKAGVDVIPGSLVMGLAGGAGSTAIQRGDAAPAEQPAARAPEAVSPPQGATPAAEAVPVERVPLPEAQEPTEKTPTAQAPTQWPSPDSTSIDGVVFQKAREELVRRGYDKKHVEKLTPRAVLKLVSQPASPAEEIPASSTMTVEGIRGKKKKAKAAAPVAEAPPSASESVFADLPEEAPAAAAPAPPAEISADATPSPVLEPAPAVAPPAASKGDIPGPLGDLAKALDETGTGKHGKHTFNLVPREDGRYLVERIGEDGFKGSYLAPDKTAAMNKALEAANGSPLKTAWAPAEAPKAASPKGELRPEPHGVSPEPVMPPGERWTVDPGAVPGEPAFTLDGDAKTGSAAIVEIQDDDGNAVFEARAAGGKVVGRFTDAKDAAKAAEAYVDEGGSASDDTESEKEPVDLRDERTKTADRAGEVVLNEIIKKGISTREIESKFWRETYPRLDAPAQKEFQRQRDWMYSENAPPLDDDPSKLVAEERGYVVLMHMANLKNDEGDSPALTSGKKEEADAPTADLEEGIRAIIREQDDDVSITDDDLVERIAEAAEDSTDPRAEKIRAAYEKYQREQDDDRRLGGRGDMDSAYDAFMGSVEKALKKKEKAPKPAASKKESSPQARVLKAGGIRLSPDIAGEVKAYASIREGGGSLARLFVRPLKPGYTKAMDWSQWVQTFAQDGLMKGDEDINGLIEFLKGNKAETKEDAIEAAGQEHLAKQEEQEANLKPVSEAAIQPGDRFSIRGEEFKALEHDDEGNLVIKDGTTYRLPPGSELEIDGGKKGIEKGKAPAAEESAESAGASDADLAQMAEAFKNAESVAHSDDQQVTHIFDPPKKDEIVRLQDKVKRYVAGKGWMSPEDAKAEVEKWKENARAQGKDSRNSGKVVLSLFDYTGEWARPWAEAGYNVFTFDIQNDPEMEDINKFSVQFLNEDWGAFEGDIYAVLAACPCTDFAVSGARHFAAKDASGKTVESVELVLQTLRTIEYLKPQVWAIENPVGRIERLTGLPPWRLSFDPNHFGAPYTKKTLLWGRFNADLPIAPVEPVEGSKMWAKYGGKSQATKNARSETPEGFAYAFFQANNAQDNMGMAIANKYDRLDADLIKKAAAVGLAENEIGDLVDDFFYFDLDDEGAEKALREAIEARKQQKDQPNLIKDDSFRLTQEEAPPAPTDARPEAAGEQPELIPGARSKYRAPEKPKPAVAPEGGLFGGKGGSSAQAAPPVDLESLSAGIRTAIEERPMRRYHGNTSANAFFVVDEKIYPHNKWDQIPEADRKRAISVHSHSGQAAEEFEARVRKKEAFQPMNAWDIHGWIKGMNRGQNGPACAVIMHDGRMAILGTTAETDPYLFKMSETKLKEYLHPSYEVRKKYYEDHKDEADYDEERIHRETLRDFADKNKLYYRDDLSWKEADPATSAQGKPAKPKKSDYPVVVSPEGKEYPVLLYAVDVRRVGPNRIGGSGWEWYGFEKEGGDVYFGLVHGFETELGSFSVSELKENGIVPLTDPAKLRDLAPPIGWKWKEEAKPEEPKVSWTKGAIVPAREGVKAIPIDASTGMHTPGAKVAAQVADFLKTKKILSPAELYRWCDSAFGGTMAEGKYSIKDAYDAMELGVNIAISRSLVTDPKIDAGRAKEQVSELKKLIANLPTQTKRTGEQEAFQQFSTPPSLAFAANWAANLNGEDVYLEPSAGIGGIAIFGKNAGVKQTIVNELSPRRAELLKELGFDRIFTENAEQLNNILPKDVRPTVVVMNPPFSATAGRLGNKKQIMTGAVHIEQALKRLEDGGRLVAIVGRGMGMDRPAFTNWWNTIKKSYTVKANVGVSGKEYTKYGTAFDNRILVIDKSGPHPADVDPVMGDVEKVEGLIDLLNGVRDDRPQVDRRAAEGKSESAQSPIEGRPAKAEGAAGSVLPLQSPAGRSGDREGSVRAEGGSPAGQHPADVRVEAGGRAAVPGEERPGRGDRPVRSDAGKAPEPGGSGRGDLERDGAQAESALGERVPDSTPEVEVRRRKAERTKDAELSDSIYEQYHPQKVSIKNAKPHPGKLVESAAMSMVEPPDVAYQPKLPAELISTGKVSEAQLEAVVYAGSAHSEMLPGDQELNGKVVKYRKGYFIGDGTGVGKGREISAILLDNWNHGRKKAIWVSQNSPLINDAKRDVAGIGWNPDLIFDVSKAKLGMAFPQKEGIGFLGYDLLKSKKARKGPEGAEAKEATRLQQIVDWLGEDFDGVIVFDEAHNMGNALAMKGSRGMTKPSEKALAGVELQRLLPNARILYVSATGATEVTNLSYSHRLGLWGEGTPFAKVRDFIDQISSGGMAAMEIVARDMKAMGKYLSRSLSYDDVSYDRLEHTLTPEQREIYDEVAQAWQIVLANIHKALAAASPQKNNGKPMINGKQKGNAMSAFWGAHQRFFNQIITSMQTPAVITAMEKDLKDNKAVVIQLVNTNEAAQTRALARLEEDQELEDLDMTPREQLMEFIKNSFPVQQYEEYMDADGNIATRPVVDSQGKPVENAEAIAMREALLDKLGSIRVPAGPMEMILDHFGTEAVAEITGRTQRVVKVRDEKGERKVVERRSQAKCMADADAFANDKKKILIFSYAGGTGRSYHADLGIKNQRVRKHYLLQAGWRADRAIQGFGRTHRSHQKQAPEYVLVTTDLKGQKRFISSIARRLDQLGALTRGQRQTGSQGFFVARDNLESVYAQRALLDLIQDLSYRKVEGMDLLDFQRETGLEIADEHGRLNVTKMPPIAQFLNRLLSMTIAQQDKVFDLFSERMDKQIKAAMEDGTLDQGLETLRAKRIEKVQEQVVFTDKAGAETKYVELEITNDAALLSFKDVGRYGAGGFVRNVKSGRVWAVSNVRSKTDRYGNVDKVHDLTGIGRERHTVNEEELKDPKKFQRLGTNEAHSAWDKEYDAAPKERKHREHMITGALLPIWDRLQGHPRIMRAQTVEGERILGRILNPSDVAETLRNLGATKSAVKMTGKETHDAILRQNYKVELANGWELVRRVVSGEQRIEILGPNYSVMDELRRNGVFSERIQYVTRHFIPTDAEKGAAVIEKITENRPIVSAEPPSSSRHGIEDAEEKLASIVNQVLPEKDPPAGLSVRPVDVVLPPPAYTEKDYAFDESDTESRYKDAHGTKKGPVLDRALEVVRSLRDKARREYEHLKRSAEFAELRYGLLRLAKQKGVASDRTVRAMQGITVKLDPVRMGLFERKVLLNDLKEEAAAEHALPFGFTAESVEAEIAKIDALVEADPIVKDAVTLRNSYVESVKNTYIGAMEAIGFHVASRFKRQNYFRHQVLEYANAKGVFGTGKKLKTPTGRGFIKKREGSELDINTNYLEAEYEVLSQMLYDIEVAKTIAMVDQSYSIADRVRASAKAKNFEMLVGGPDRVAEIRSLKSQLEQFKNMEPLDSDERRQRGALSSELMKLDPTRPYEIKMAIGFGKLEKLGITIEDDANIFKVLSELMKGEGPEAPAAGMILKAISDREKFIKTSLGKRYLEWKSAIDPRAVPEGYVLWQPREGNVFFFADSIPAQLAEKLREGLIEKAELNLEDLRRTLVSGGQRKQFVLKEEVAQTLDNLVRDKAPGVLHGWDKKILTAWKVWQLVSPRRFGKYNLRNLAGDADAVIVGNPSTFKKLPQALRELYQVFYADRGMTPEMRAWFYQGGFETTLQAQEFSELNKLRVFQHIRPMEEPWYKMPAAGFKKYWQVVRLATDFREASLRYAAFLDYREQMESNKSGRPKNFGASIEQEIMALKDLDERAFVLSNQLLGAYDQVGVMGQALREHLYPFWSWKEVNFKRYIQFAKNAAADGKIARAVGRKALGSLARSPYTAYRVGGFLIKATALWAMLTAWNNLMFPDEEREISEENRALPHIIFGRDGDGKIVYFNRLGALTDLLAWFGLDKAPMYVAQWASGRRSLREVAIEMAKSPVNVVVQGVTPAIKMPAELITKRILFPDVFRPRPMRDWKYYLMQSFGLENEYKALTDVPGEQYVKSLSSFLVYKSDPGQNAYSDILSEKSRFLERKGKASQGAFISPKANALYNLRLAIRYQDERAKDTFLREYIALGGTREGIQGSLKRMHPLGGLSLKEAREFKKELTPDMRELLAKSILFYEAVLNPGGSREILREARRLEVRARRGIRAGVDPKDALEDMQ